MKSAIERAFGDLVRISGQDEEAGDVETIGWHGLFRGPVNLRELEKDGAIEEGTVAEILEDGDHALLEQCRTGSGVIFRTDSQGFDFVEIYRPGAGDRLEAAWSEILSDETDANGPQEEDWTTEDHLTFRSVGGGIVLEITEDDDMGAEIRAQMEKDGFFPNVWFVSDHGNAHLIEF